MKFNSKLLILTVVLLAMISLGAVSAADDVNGADDGSDVISVSQDEADQFVSEGSQTYNNTIYVDSRGDDSGSGTQESPYASLNKAISSVDASDNAIINVAAGIYTGENNTDLKINLAHIKYNGSLTIAGAGSGKTIIDANFESPIFTSISADSIVILKDITFINGKNNLGSAIYSEGNLTIDSCVFEKNAAGAYGTVYQDEPNSFKVVNSVFRDNTAGSGNVNIYYSTYQDNDYVVEIINNTFSNATTDYGWADSSCVYIQASHILVKGNTFANISGTGKGNLNVRADDCNVTDNVFKDCSYDGSNDGGILYIGDAYLKGNTFENWTSTKGAAIYALLNFNANLTFNDKLVEGTSFELTCNVTDDMGNPVNTYGEVYFYLDGEKMGSTKANKGVATLDMEKLLNNGTYELSGTYKYSSWGDTGVNPFECTVKNAIVTVDFDHAPMEVWVAADGNDTTGNGSESNPFQTIKTAIDYAIDEDSVDIVVHVKDGLYNISGDYGLSYSEVVKISIVGENYGKAIISANNEKFTLLTSGVNTDVSFKNLTFVNSTANNAFSVRYLTMEDCIVKNVGQLNAQTNPSRIVLKNVIWTKSKRLMMYYGEIYNSLFENITASGNGILWLATSYDVGEIIIANSKFINITNTGNGPILYVSGDLKSFNNTFASNNASGDTILEVSSDYMVSVNDTFINNYAGDDYGAAFFAGTDENAFVGIAYDKFINNTAEGNGGALGTYGALIINCTFENNTAGENGGAIYTPTTNQKYFNNLTLIDVTFKNNVAGTNGQDIFIAPPTTAAYSSTNLTGMTVTFNDLSTETMQDFVSANVTHTSGAIIGGGKITFYLNESYMGVADVIDGVATLDYLGFKKNGTYVLSGKYDLETEDTVYNNATVVVALAPLKDFVVLYVSDSKGNDTIGNGSFDNPYKSIKTALNSGYKQSMNITICVLEGTYTGNLNTNLTIIDSLTIAIIGEGQDKTIIDGQDVSWFLNILAGDGTLGIANMTIANVTKNYVDAKAYNQKPALSIEKDAIVTVDGVKFIRCHGTEGGAIYSEGVLTVKNSYFFNNGDSNNGAAIENMGYLVVENSKFVANHAKYYSTIYNQGQLFMFDSIIEDSMRVNGWAGNAYVIGGTGNITLDNTTISRSGKTCAELIGAGQTWANNPGFAIALASRNIKIFNSVIDGHDKTYSAQYVANVAFTESGSGVPVLTSLEVVNTKILNLNNVISNANGVNMFDTCCIENVTYISQGTSYDYNLTVVNSCFADGTTMLTKKATANVVLDNNWWGSNDQPTYKVSNADTHPDTWLILTFNVTDDKMVLKNGTLAFKVTDGENITDYAEAVYPRDYVITTIVNGVENSIEGVIDNSEDITFSFDKPGYYVEATVDNQVIAFGAGESEILAENVSLMLGETQFYVTVLVNDVPVSNFNINVTVNKKSYEAEVIDGVAEFTIDELPYGDYTLDYVIVDNQICSGSTASANLTVLRFDPEITFASNETDELIIIMKDNDGNPLEDMKIDYSVDGINGTGTTDSNGQIIVPDLRGDVDVVATFKGDDTFAPLSVEETVTIFNGRKDTSIAILSVDGYLNVVGILVDEDGITIENATIIYAFGNESGNTTTDENGTFTVSAQNGVILFSSPETHDYEVSYAFLVLKDIAPVRQETEIEIALGDIKIDGDVNVNITVLDNVTGELYVYVDDEDEVVIPVTDGKANYTIKAVAAGNHTIVVAYLGDVTHEPSVDSKDFNVDKLEANVTVTATGAKVGQAATITVNVTDGATGGVAIYVGDAIYGIHLEEGNTLELVLYEAGNYTVSAYYLGDDRYDESESSEVTLVIAEKDDANIKVDVPKDVKVCDTIVINVTADTDAALEVFINAEPQTVVNGTVTYVVGQEDTYVILVASNETADYDEGVELVSFDATKKDAEISINATNVLVGEKSNVTITLTAGAAGYVIVTVDDETFYAVEFMHANTATLEVPFDEAGNHTIYATYLGDIEYNVANSKDITVVVSDKPVSEVNITAPANVTAGENANVTVDIPGATGNVSVIVDGIETTVALENGSAVVPIENITAGKHGVVVIYSGDADHDAAVAVSEFDVPEKVVPVKHVSEFTNIIVSGEGQITAMLMDDTGAPIKNANITYIISGAEVNATTDAAGVILINASSNTIVDIRYAGDDLVLPTAVSIALKDLAAPREASVINAKDLTQYAVDFRAGERGGYFNVQLVDVNGKPLANKAVKIGFNGVVYDRTTNETGWTRLQINLANANEVTFAVAFLGDNDYNGSFVVQKITILKKKTSISASAKSFKASAKSKKYTVTLKTDKGSSIDGQTYLSAGKKLSITINGKTYTAKTNAKGQATFKLSINKKGKYTSTVKFEGDDTYLAASKSVKITIN